MDQFASFNGQMPVRKRSKTFGESLKARYSRACYIMSKIENNERRGKPHACDQKDRKRCEIVIEEYLRYQRTQAEMKLKEEQAKKAQEKKGMGLNKKWEAGKTKSEQAVTSNLSKNELCMALVNEKDGNLQPVVAEWPIIETRLSDILFKYLLRNKNCCIPRYDSGEIYRGYYLIQCKDLFSKEFLCNCITQVKDEFEGLQLNVIEKDKIPKESNTLEKLQKEDLSNETLPSIPAPPSPPVWQKLSASTSARDKHRYYLNCLDRMKIYAAKGTLNQNERRNQRKCRRSIRKYEERNGLPPTQTQEAEDGQQNDQGFQLSVNYFESAGMGGLREQMGEFSQSSWNDQRSSNCFAGDQGNNLNWGANSSWNYGQFEPEGYQQQLGTNSSFNRQNFTGEMPYNAGSNYEFPRQSSGRPESAWNYGGSESATFFERRGIGESFNHHNNFDFGREQMSNSSWNYGEPPAESYQDMGGNRQSQDFNFKRRHDFDSGFNDMRQPEENFSSNQASNGLWNDYNPEFERRQERRENSSTNSQSLEPSSNARNDFESEQTWTTNQLPTTSWNYDEPREGNFNSPNPRFLRSNFNLETQNSPQHVSTLASTSSGNKMTNSDWNNSNSAERSQSFKDPSSLPNNSNTEEDSAKILLEKKIFELLNALSGANTEEEQLCKEKLPQKLPISQTNLNKARENLSINLRKSKSDLPATEVITLSDDSDQEKEKEDKDEKAEKEYFKALTYLRKLEGNKSLTEQEQFFKETSEFIVKQYENKFGSKTQKTKQPQEKSNERQNRKSRWSSSANTNNTPTYAGNSNQVETNPDLQVAIINRKEPDLSIHKHLWSQLEGSLIKALHQEVEKTNNINITQFDAKDWKYGVKIIQCENMEALYFIKRFIIKYSLEYPRQQFDVIPISELPKRSIVKVWIPPPNADDKAMLKIIKAQNHTLCTDCWTLINSRERPNKKGKELYISISAASVEKLRFVKGEIRYGISRLKMELLEEQEFGREP